MARRGLWALGTSVPSLLHPGLRPLQGSLGLQEVKETDPSHGVTSVSVPCHQHLALAAQSWGAAGPLNAEWLPC